MVIGQHMFNLTRSLRVLTYYWATTRNLNSVGQGLHTNIAGFKIGPVRERGYSRTSRVVIIKFRNKTDIIRLDSTGVREVGTLVYYAPSQPLIIAISVCLDL